MPDSVGSKGSRLSEKVLLAVLLALLLAGRVVMSVASGYTADDAFITYRFAENVAGGHGFVYNEGERVQGTSSPLYTILLSGCAVVAGPERIPIASKMLSLVADCLTLVALWFMLANMRMIARFFVGVLFALYPKTVLICTEGMEMSLVLAIMMLSFLALRKGKVLTGCVLLGLMLVTRIDSALWALLCLSMVRAVRLSKGSVAALLGPLTAWSVFSQLYFGTIVPHTVTAKLLSWHHLFPAFDPVRVLRGYFPFHGLLDASIGIQALAGVILVVPALIALVLTFRSKSTLIVFPLFFLLYNFAFAFGRVIMTDWYYLPGFVSYFIVLGYLVDMAVMAYKGKQGHAVLDFASVIPIGVLLFVLNVWGIGRWSKDPGEWFQSNHVRLGSWLSIHAPAKASVLLEPIGYVGWKSKLQVHDLIGMVSPQVFEYRKRFPSTDAWFLRYVRDVLPSYIVLQRNEIPENALFLGHGDGIFQSKDERLWFDGAYREIKWGIGNKQQGSQYYALYERVDQLSMRGVSEE